MYNSGKPLYTSLSIKQEIITDKATGEQQTVQVYETPFVKAEEKSITFETDIPLCVYKENNRMKGIGKYYYSMPTFEGEWNQKVYLSLHVPHWICAELQIVFDKRTIGWSQSRQRV